MKYYKSTNRYTQISGHSWIINRLKYDTDFLFAVVKSILIHPVDAGKVRVKYDRKNSGIFHCQNSTVDKILDYEKLQQFFSRKILPLETKPNDRAVLSCDHHALLYTSFVRYLGIPIRVRTGFSTYIVPGLAVPHWVTEVYNQKNKEWIVVDPERQIENVDRDQFIFSCDAWNQHLHNGRQFQSYSGFSGRQGLKYALLCDLNCIFKTELLSYEWRLKEHNRKKPDIARTSFERLTLTEQQLIHEIAELMTKPDDNIFRLWELYSMIVEKQDRETSGFGKYKKCCNLT